jgi:GMP synthase-like glutamine amidotransferase
MIDSCDPSMFDPAYQFEANKNAAWGFWFHLKVDPEKPYLKLFQQYVSHLLSSNTS